MKLFTRAKPDPHPERRAAPRTRVDCLATLLMPSGDRIGRLFDISTAGARFTTQDPPAMGSSAILDWNTGEAYCMVIWTRPGMCGVEFDRPIPQHVIDHLAEANPSGPRLVSAPPEGNAEGGPPAPAPSQRFVC